MKHLNQFCIILCFSLAGEVLNRVIPLPIPASVYGILLLFLALCIVAVVAAKVVFPHPKEDAHSDPDDPVKDEEA